MDVVCFSFDCHFNDDGNSNCSTIDPTLPTSPASHPTEAPSPSPTTHTATTPVQTPSPTKPVTTRIPTAKPTSSHPPSQKPSVATTPNTSRLTVTLPQIVTSHVADTTTTNISTSHLPMRPEVTSPSTPGSADGKSIYIPCSVVGFAVVVFLLVSIGIVRRRRNRSQSSEERQLLCRDTESSRTVGYHTPFILDPLETIFVQPATSSPDAGPTSPGVPLVDDNDDIDLLELSSDDSDDWKTAPNSQWEQGGNYSKVV